MQLKKKKKKDCRNALFEATPLLGKYRLTQFMLRNLFRDVFSPTFFLVVLLDQ